MPRDRGSVGVEKEMGTKMGITKMKKKEENEGILHGEEKIRCVP